jgi:hypothetical protein
MAPIKTHADVPGSSPQLRDALRGAASAHKENGPRFALAGSYALWAYGAPEPTHDVDLVVAESDVDDAVATLTNAVSPITRGALNTLRRVRSVTRREGDVRCDAR